MMLTQSYEPQRNLLVGMDYHRGNTLVTQRTYTYDPLDRPLTRSTARNGQIVNDTFAHNSRSELASAMVNGKTEIILQNSDLIIDVISNEIYLDALVVSISSGRAIPNPRCAVKQTKQCALKLPKRKFYL